MSGWRFLQVPGPSNVPLRVRQAISRPTIDHRGAEFSDLVARVTEGLRRLAGTGGRVMIYPSSGTGAWEAALVNTLSVGESVLVFETGHFAVLWADLARRLGLEVVMIEGDWRRGVDPDQIFSALKAHPTISAVCIIHNETSTGVTSDVASVRAAINDAGSEALLMVDAISSLGCVRYQHDHWGVDVTVGCSQKGLMLPPGLGFNVVGDKAWEKHATGMPRHYWDWRALDQANANGQFPYTPATNLLFGLDESLSMLFEEGLDETFERHETLASVVREAARDWALEIVAIEPNERSASITGLFVPPTHDSKTVVAAASRIGLDIGIGLGRHAGLSFRIGHLGDLNALMTAATLCGVEMSLRLSGIDVSQSAIPTALGNLAGAIDPAVASSA